jgi:hypothetical protein
MNPFETLTLDNEDYLMRYAAETTKPRIPINRYLDGQAARAWSGSDRMNAWWNYRTYLIGAGLRSRSGETADD